MNLRKKITCLALSLAFSSIGWGADFQEGQEAYNSGDYQTAIAQWQPLAEEGRANGQFGMGLLYANGFGVSMDDAEALKWYGMAAEQNHAMAQCNLAVMHANGWGVPQSDDEALKWYRLSAEQGIIEAQIAVAKMYERGLGVEEDKVQAHKWFGIAANLGDDGAPFKLEELAARMSAEELAEASTLASTWMQNHDSLLASH